MSDDMRWFGRYLVTGGAGFLGSHLVDRLLDGGAETVWVLDNLSTGRTQNLRHAQERHGRRLRFIYGDVREPWPEDTPVDGLFHLASVASPDDYLPRPIETLEVCSVGIANAVEWAKRSGCRMLYTSTSEIYGDPQVHPQPEDYWGFCNPYGPRAGFDEGKRYAEAYMWAAQRDGLDGRMVRLFNAYGGRMKYDDGRVVARFVGQALRGLPVTVFGDGQQTRSFCYIGDMVSGLLDVFASDETRPVNLGTHEETSILDLAKLVINTTGSASTIAFWHPREEEPTRRRPVTDRAHALGWKPHTDLASGILKTADWVATQGD